MKTPADQIVDTSSQVQILVHVGARIRTTETKCNRYNRREFVALATQISHDKYLIHDLGVVYGDIEIL